MSSIVAYTNAASLWAYLTDVDLYVQLRIYAWCVLLNAHPLCVEMLICRFMKFYISSITIRTCRPIPLQAHRF